MSINKLRRFALYLLISLSVTTFKWKCNSNEGAVLHVLNYSPIGQSTAILSIDFAWLWGGHFSAQHLPGCLLLASKIIGVDDKVGVQAATATRSWQSVG